MSRLKRTIQQKLDKQEKLLIPYIVAGDPNMSSSLQLMLSLVAAGADIIELGVPFSDPSSDGPVIQQASERALQQGTTLADVLDLVARFRATDEHTPIVLMGYLNPVEIMGYEAFANNAGAAGVDGVLIVDMPPTESGSMVELLKAREIDTIFLVAPTTSQERAKTISQRCSGYLYYVSLKGVTGASIIDSDSIVENVTRLRKLSDLPIVIGFGIKDGESAEAMAKLADGVVIGSALVEKIGHLQDVPDQKAGDIAAAVDLISVVRNRLNNMK